MKNSNKYPLTYPKTNLNLSFFKEVRDNFDKCINVAISDNKKKTKGKVINIFTNTSYGRFSSGSNTGDGLVVVTVKYTSSDGVERIGESYRDWPADCPGVGKETDIWYLDSNYDFIFLDEIQFVKNDDNFLDTEQKRKAFLKAAKPYLVLFAICMATVLIAVSKMNAYYILVSELCFILSVTYIWNKKSKAESIGMLFVLPLFLNLFIVIKYIFDFMIKASYKITILDYLICALQFLPILVYYVFTKIKFKKVVKK